MEVRIPGLVKWDTDGIIEGSINRRTAQRFPIFFDLDNRNWDSEPTMYTRISIEVRVVSRSGMPCSASCLLYPDKICTSATRFMTRPAPCG